RHTFDPGRTPTALRRYEQDADWELPAVAARYPRLSTDREMAEENNLEWVTPGHPLFEALRRHTLALSRETFQSGTCFYSVQHDAPARIDFYRARVVDGIGRVIHERLFAVELRTDTEPRLSEPTILGNFSQAELPPTLPALATLPEATAWLHEQSFRPF